MSTVAGIVRPEDDKTLGPLLEWFQRRRSFQYHAAGAGHGAAVDHDVAGNQQACLALGPRPVQTNQRIGRRLIGVRHVFFHRGLGDAVRNDRTPGQHQFFKDVHSVTSF